MKVLKPGRPQSGWAKKMTCTGKGNGGGGCGAILLVEEGDVYKTTRCCYDETDYFLTFRCAACGVETDIDNPPSALWDKVGDRNKPLDRSVAIDGL